MSHEPDFTRTFVVLAMAGVLMALLVLEIRFLRTRRRKRADAVDLPDRAHNALVTTKAIAEALGRGGVRSPEAEDMIREAEAAIRTRNYRVAIDLADRAKGLLRGAKQRYDAMGDLAKVEGPPPAADAEEMTTKEKLTKESPPNYVQSKFSINLTQEAIDAARGSGVNVREAERQLAHAHASFEAKEYDAALRQAVRAQRALETGSDAPADVAPDPVTPSPNGASVCPNCGASVAADDAFCRRCGAKLQ